MPTVDKWRGLWLELYQLLGLVYTGVLGLELSLDLAECWYSMSHPENNLKAQFIAYVVIPVLVELDLVEQWYSVSYPDNVVIVN
jgi:uncharacterized membrane protein required for colicin V production